MSAKKIEIGLILGIGLIHALCFVNLLSGWTTLNHDNLLWNYPVFVHFFGELAQGHWPIYNFFSRFGEPFVPAAAQMRYWDPVLTLLGVTLTKSLGDPLVAFNWFRYILGVVHCLGIYWCFQQYAQSLPIRILLWVTILFSSIFFGSFQQDGIINQFLWIPFLVLLLRRKFIEQPAGIMSCVALGLLIASSFQSYFFIIPNLFLGFYLVVTWLSGEKIRSLGTTREVARRLFFILIPMLPMTYLNLVSFKQSQSWIFPGRTPPLVREKEFMFGPERLRMAELQQSSLRLDAEGVVALGTSSRLWDYVQMFNPYGNREISPLKKYHFGEPSEAIIVFSLVAIILGFVGLAVDRNQVGAVWLNIVCLFFVLSLGREAGVYPRLVHWIPLLGYVRQTHCLVMYVEFAFMYFVTIGGNYIYSAVRHRMEAVRT